MRSTEKRFLKQIERRLNISQKMRRHDRNIKSYAHAEDFKEDILLSATALNGVRAEMEKSKPRLDYNSSMPLIRL